MLTHEITYEDFNGNKSTEKLYFNLTKSEVFELIANGLGETMEKINKAEDVKSFVIEFKKKFLRP